MAYREQEGIKGTAMERRLRKRRTVSYEHMGKRETGNHMTEMISERKNMVLNILGTRRHAEE